LRRARQIEKQFGKGSVMRLGDARHLDIDAVPRLPGLDIALGCGGLPRGRVSRSTG